MRTENECVFCRVFFVRAARSKDLTFLFLSQPGTPEAEILLKKNLQKQKSDHHLM